MQKMASHYSQILALLFLISITSSFAVDYRQIPVSVTNDIPNQDLTVHCKSNTGIDLDTTVIQYGKSFVWTGKIIPGTREIYFCDLHTPSGLHGLFTLFISTRDASRCRDHCLWSARLDGIYLYDPDLSDYELQFKWW